MITKISIKNFKKLDNISFTTTQSVVLIGPNNSGKTTLFQALCLWELGVTAYLEAEQKQNLSSGGYVTINRQDLMNSPIIDARFLWKDKKVTFDIGTGRRKLERDTPLEIELEGENDNKKWVCKAEFTFSNAESITCQLLSGLDEMRDLYQDGNGIRFGFLQAMSGLAISEDKLTKGSVDRLLGEGRTAEVLRNICFDILYPEQPKPSSYQPEENWGKLVKNIEQLFGATIDKPELIRSRGLIDLFYTENGIRYDVSSGGRGFQQTLLLLAYLYSHPNTTLLLDEPDAHLEVIRQREIFQMLNKVATEMGSQIFIASHSEVVLDEAAEHAQVIALIENQIVEINGSHQIKALKKALTNIGWEKYYLARLKKHILYLEGSTDLEMLLAFARQLKHPVERHLSEANVHYLSNNLPNDAKQNFAAIQPFVPNLKGLAVFDKLGKDVEEKPIEILCWTKREIENYFARPFILKRFAMSLAIEHKKDEGEFGQIMNDVIINNTLPRRLNNLEDTWWSEGKLTDDWLDLIFPEFYEKVKLSPIFRKGSYYQLIQLLNKEEIDAEIIAKLDKIHAFLR
jgi:AAA15 family ATPase/GTPase